MRNNIYLLLVLVLCAACATQQSSRLSTSEVANVKQVLANQAACWSNGDLECYMQGYWQSDSLLFIGSRGLTYGWQQTLANYKRSYPDPAAMGKLNFELKEVKTLSPETMLVVGKWHLERDAAKGDLQGHFSVIFQRFKDGWKIIADHSS